MKVSCNLCLFTSFLLLNYHDIIRVFFELKLLSEFLLEPPNSQIMKRYILEVRYFKVMMTLLKVLYVWLCLSCLAFLCAPKMQRQDMFPGFSVF